MFLLGIGLQFLLTGGWHLDANVSFVVQGIVSVELSYLLNRRWTWRRESVPFWRGWRRFHVQKAITFLANLIVYGALVRLGINYLVANATTTALFTIGNYAAAHFWSFRPPGPAGVYGNVPDFPRPSGGSATGPQTVSVVVPCRGSEQTIRATLDSLLGQSYPGLIEVILVGSAGDATWQALAGIDDPRLIIMEREECLSRDSNAKRDTGLRKARGDVLALADSDIVMHPDWLSRGLTLLSASEADCVAGGMTSIHEGFWGRFVDGTRMAAKTPRISRSYLVNRENFGHRGAKPPITANVLFTRELYRDCPMDPSWTFGYEDYEWFWRVAGRGHQILLSAELSGKHHHRRGLLRLCRDYRRSGSGCAWFIRRHPDCPLSRRRLTQAVLLPAAAVSAAFGEACAGAALGPVIPLAAIGCTAVLAAAWEYADRRNPEALLYPVVNVILGATFLASMIRVLMSGVAEAGARHRAVSPLTWVRQRGAWSAGLALAGILAAAALLRLWDVGNKPGWQSDETVYTDIARTLATSGLLSEHTQYQASWAPFLFHPPFYFLLLAGWFKIVGAGVPQARALSAIASVVTLCLLARLIWKLHGQAVALVTAAFLAFDGWLLYVQRVSYIENVLLLIIVTGFLLYERALRCPSAPRFVLAGIVLGLAIVFKQTGFYVLPAVLLNWLIIRKEKRNHWFLLSGMGGVMCAYLGVMIPLFDPGKHDWFAADSMIQLERVLYLRVSRGTLSSPGEFVHLLMEQYVVFLPSFAVALAGVIVIVVKFARARSLLPAERNSLLFSWAVAGVVVFGASALRYDQYFELALIPLYCLLWTEACQFVRSRRHLMPAAAAAGLIVLAAGLGTFCFRVAGRSDNALYQVQQYALAHIPRGSVVITEEDIGDEIQQPWCSTTQASVCGASATYAITYASYLQSATPPDDSAFQALMTDATSAATFQGFKETITVWRLRRPPAS
jgi:4-amino-4-deoxy-L-arabinose transferase-like glycosyltransferase/putative flippase GtrA